MTPSTYTWTGMLAVVSGSMVQPETSMVPGPRRAESSEPNGLPNEGLRGPASSVRYESGQQKRFRSTVHGMPGEEPVEVHCQNVHVAQLGGIGLGAGALVQFAIHSG